MSLRVVAAAAVLVLAAQAALDPERIAAELSPLLNSRAPAPPIVVLTDNHIHKSEVLLRLERHHSMTNVLSEVARSRGDRFCHLACTDRRNWHESRRFRERCRILGGPYSTGICTDGKCVLRAARCCCCRLLTPPH